MVVVVLQHVEEEGAGRIGNALDRAGVPWRTSAMHRGDTLPESLAEVHAVVAMGGPMGVDDTDRYPRLAQERRLMREAVAAGIPVLGVCLGAQLLAASAGARVRPGRALELGWGPIRLSDAGRGDALLGGLGSPQMVLHWHRDAFDLPPGAVSLASSDLTEHQAFRLGASAYGLLFHLEADEKQVELMGRAFAAEMAEAGVTSAELAQQTVHHAYASGVAGDRLFDTWARLL